MSVCQSYAWRYYTPSRTLSNTKLLRNYPFLIRNYLEQCFSTGGSWHTNNFRLVAKTRNFIVKWLAKLNLGRQLPKVDNYCSILSSFWTSSNFGLTFSVIYTPGVVLIGWVVNSHSRSWARFNNLLSIGRVKTSHQTLQKLFTVSQHFFF